MFLKLKWWNKIWRKLYNSRPRNSANFFTPFRHWRPHRGERNRRNEMYNSSKRPIIFTFKVSSGNTQILHMRAFYCWTYKNARRFYKGNWSIKKKYLWLSRVMNSTPFYSIHICIISSLKRNFTLNNKILLHH